MVAGELFEALGDPTRRIVLDELAHKSGQPLCGPAAAGSTT
ncbi:helix-turn-helix transcriptional regulator [Streptomyces sp. NPDC093801]